VSESQRERRLEELFQVAVNLPRAEREGFFTRHCGDDTALRQELEELLRYDDEDTKEFLQSPVLEGGAPFSTDLPGTDPARGDGGGEAPADPMSERIGRYLILEKIGEGGMGAVYRAEQERPVRRPVALKIVKLGMDTERVVARFELERQTLALMEHPGIARILDGGATDNGRPYFVMEYAPGLPITEYCDRERLTVDARLRLFSRVCEAIQHAHQKGVIHRDIKPTNVLVTTRDGEPAPKVIDFGIAFVTSEASDDTRVARETRESEVIGTCYYMSPEQGRPNGGDVDTRTDVYSLGVLLYELLTGVLPYDREELRAKSPSEVQRILADLEPLPPSTRLARLADAADELAALRGHDARGLARRLAGDLDWIVMKAIEKDRSRRYATASELAADVARHLALEPVLASPPSVTYRVSKFVRRHRVGVLSGVLATLALIAGIIGTTWAMLEAEAQRELADAERDHALYLAEKAHEAEQQADRERKAADAARERADRLRQRADEARADAEAESQLSQTVTRFLVDTLSLADPEISLDPDLPVYALLQRAGQKVEGAFVGYPEGEGALRKTLGRAFYSVGDLDQAEVHLERALEIQESEVSTPLSELVDTMWRLSEVYRDSGSQNSDDLAWDACHQGFDVVADTHPDLADELDDLFHDVLDLRIEEAVLGFDAARRRCDELIPAGDPLWRYVARLHEFLGLRLGYRWGRVEALLFLEESLDIRRRELPPTHPEIGRSLEALVSVMNRHGRFADAEELVMEALDIYRNALPDGHYLRSIAESLLGECLSGLDRPAQAEEALLESHQALVESRGRFSRAAVDSAFRLVRHYDSIERPELAAHHRALLAQAYGFSKNAPRVGGLESALFGPEHASLLEAFEELEQMVADGPEATVVEHHRDDFGAALRGVIALRRASLPDDHPLAVVVARLVNVYARFDAHPARDTDLDVATETLRVLGGYEEEFPVPVAEAWKLLGLVTEELDDVPRAERCYLEALRVFRREFGVVSVRTLEMEQHLARCLYFQGRHAEIESQLIESWQVCVDTVGTSHRASAKALSNLIDLYDHWERPTHAASFIEAHLRSDIAEDVNPQRLANLSWNATRTPGFEAELYELARASAARAVELLPGDAYCVFTLGSAYFRLGRLATAIETLTASLGQGEGDPVSAWAMIAMAHHDRGEKAAAADALERSRQLLRSPDLNPDLDSHRVLFEAVRHLGS